MKKLRIAQIGTSLYSHGEGIFKTILRFPEIFEVVGYALPEKEREKFPERMAAFADFPELTVDEILSDPTIDAVFVETEEIYLTKYAQMVADSGKHIHMEKPGSQDLAAFEKLIQTVKEKNLVFHIGYMYRYNPMVRELMEQIEKGELGQIVCVEAQMSGNQEPELRQWLPTFRGGQMFYLGCHIIDLAFRILGQPTQVLPLNFATCVDGIDGEDFCMAVLRYPQAIATVRSDGIQHGGYLRRELVVTGSKKTVELRPIEMRCPGGQQATLTEYDAEDWFEPGKSRTTDRYLRYGTMLQSFAAMVRGEQQNPYTPDYELALFKLILQCCGMPV